MKTDKLIKHLFEGLKQKGVNEISAIRKISEKFDIEATEVMNIVEGKSFRKDDKYGDNEKKKETFGDRQKRQSEKKKDKDNLNEDLGDEQAYFRDTENANISMLEDLQEEIYEFLQNKIEKLRARNS
jgi:hypothetical protein